jgi:sodium/proline symporter
VALYAVIIAYFAILLVIGAVASRRIVNLTDYYVGGKRLGYWVVAFSARASGESAWLYLGLTGLGAFVGMRAMWVVLGECLGVGVAWFLMARPFKRATDKYGSITVPDYLVSRFSTPGDPQSARWGVVLRLVAAAALSFFVTIYVSAQIDATGKAFESFLNWNYFVGAAFGFAIVVIYTLSGGFVAVAWSDLFQGLLMLAGLVLLPIAALASVPEGQSVWTGLEQMQSGLTSLWGPGGATLENALIIVAYLAIGLGFLGSPQVFVRFMSIRDEGQILAGRWVAILFTLLTDGGAVLAGMFGRYLLSPPGAEPKSLFGDGALLGPSGENILPLMVHELFPAAIVGFYIAAVLAATMSTIDSLLVVASSAMVRDVYQQNFVPKANTATLTRLSRWVTLGMSVAALALALTIAALVPGRTIFWFVIFGFSGIAATFCPVIVLSLCWERYNVFGALASMLTGFACIPIFKFALPLIPVWGPYISLAEEMAPSFFLALVAGVVVTLATSRKRVGEWGSRGVGENDG